MQKAILMMPYMLPLTVGDRERASLGQNLFFCATVVYIAFSRNDPWWEHSKVLVEAFGDLDTAGRFSFDLYPLGHDDIFSLFKDSLGAD